jgi:hypothetical protein
MDSCRSSGGFNNGLLKLSGKDSQFNIYEGVDASLFHDVFEVTRKYLKNGELVDLHEIETTEDGIGYNDCYNYLSEDGLSGFSITPDGDLISVFNASKKGGFLRAIAPVVKEKAKTLDCYASPNQNLMEMYQKVFGFKTASVMDYNMDYDHDNIAENHGMPQIAFMVNSESDVETKSFTKDQYDEAVTYRNSFVNQATDNEIAPLNKASSSDDVFFDGKKPKYSLSAEGEAPKSYGTYNVYGKDIGLAPVRADISKTENTTEGIAENATTTPEMVAPVVDKAVAPMAEANEAQIDELRMQRGQIHAKAWELDNKSGRTEAETLEMQRLYKQIDEITEEIQNALDKKFPEAIYNKGEAENGWSDVYEGAMEALVVAVRKVNGDLWTDISEEVDNSVATKNPNTPMLNAMIAVQEDVRQDTITPMQGAQLLADAYNRGGANALKGLFNPATGNLYDKYLDRAKQYDTIAPMVDKAVDKSVDESVYPEDFAPMEHSSKYEGTVEGVKFTMDRLSEEASRLYSEGKVDEAQAIIERMQELNESTKGVRDKYNTLRAEERAETEGYLNSLTDADAPPEIEAPYYEDGGIIDPFEGRDVQKVGNRKVKAFMDENPEVKPYFQEEANILLGELQSATKGEKMYIPTPDGHLDKDGSMVYGTDSYGIWMGTSRSATDDIVKLLDDANGNGRGYTYAEIEKGLKDIIEDNGKENNACSKRIEFVINDRLMNGYTTSGGVEVPANQEYRNLIKEKGVLAGREEAFGQLTNEDIAPIAEKYETIKPKPETTSGPSMKRADNPSNAPSGMEERRWVGTSTSSEAVGGIVTPDDIPDEVRYYQVKSNKSTLAAANARLAKDGYAKSREYFEGRMTERKLTVEDVALGERLIQEAAKAGDAKAVRDLIIDVSIIGTELGQRVQALSMIRRLTPEGQLKALTRMVERGKAKGDKAFEGVEVTDDMTNRILQTYKTDGTFDQAELNAAVEDVKQQIADKMKVTIGDRINAWRYLAMLGNPKTHIRNIVSNVAMMGTREVKNAVARTIEDIAPIQTRTKTWKRATDEVKAFAKQTTNEMKSAIQGDTKYSEEGSIKAKRQMFGGIAPLNAVNKFNSNALEFEDYMFSRPAFKQTLQEYLTANGIETETDILNNPEIVSKARDYALEEAKRATFRQDSYLASKIHEVEKKNAIFGVAVGSVMPFKKTPINIAKTGLAYSPLGFARNIYDAVQVKKGNMDASEAVDHLAQTLTGTSLTVLGFALASMGVINGAGDDDKEGKYDYQLGKQSYSINLFGNSYSLSWLSPVAMPLFVGANAYEILVEQKEWDVNVVVDTLAQTLDPLSEMSFLSSLDDVLSSYDSGTEKFMAAGESMVQNYATQFIPTLSSQVAATFDDTKRSTAASRDSGFKFGEETYNKIAYKIPGLRNTLEPTTDIWGNEAKQDENVLVRGFNSFFNPANKREGIGTAVDEELKSLYGETDDSGVLPSIPQSYINYNGEKYNMSSEEYTEYKKLYGQTAYDLMEKLFATETYKNASSEERADMVNRVYDYARDNAKKEYFAGIDLDFTNATEGGNEVYKENSIVGAIEADLPVDEYEFSTEYPEKYKFFKDNDLYDSYKSADEDGKRAYNWAYENPGKYTMSKAISNDFLEFYGIKSEMSNIKGVDKDGDGKSDSGTRKSNIISWLNGLDMETGQRAILYRMVYDSKADKEKYNNVIVRYLNTREDITRDEKLAILAELGMRVDSEGYVWWD